MGTTSFEGSPQRQKSQGGTVRVGQQPALITECRRLLSLAPSSLPIKRGLLP